MILFPLMKNSDKPLRLLLIEDDELSREVLTLQMTAQGYQVESAESGGAALLLLEQMQHPLPNAVLTDLQLPGTSGQDLLHRLRAIIDAGTPLTGNERQPAGGRNPLRLRRLPPETIHNETACSGFTAAR